MTKPRRPLAASALEHSKKPALVFGSPLSDDDAGVVDLRDLDTPKSDNAIRNELRARWKKQKRLVVRVDAEPSARVRALLFELSRNELRLSADRVERFAADHSVVVRTEASAPPAGLVAFFPIRVRASEESHARRR